MPERSVQKRRPSGANASAVAKLALIVPPGGDCGPMLHPEDAGGFDADFVGVGLAEAEGEDDGDRDEDGEGDGDGDVELADGFGGAEVQLTNARIRTISPTDLRRRTGHL